MRVQLDRTVDAATRELARAWSRAWREIIAEWEVAVDDLMKIEPGKWPKPSQIDRATRAQKALRSAAQQLEALSTHAGVTITGRILDLVNETQDMHARIAKTQLPHAGFSITFDRMDEEALNAIVKRTTGQIESRLRPLSVQATEAMRQVLVRGITTGTNPRRAARVMLARTQGAFNGGLHRAENIAITEMLDAHRESAHRWQQKHASVMRGWIWLAALDSRTCPACLDMHGTEHKIEELGPIDHPRGRCSRMPITKSWKELGIDAPETPAVPITKARDWFERQPRSVRLNIMGPERLRKLETGELSWGKIATIRPNPNWRPSIATASLS